MWPGLGMPAPAPGIENRMSADSTTDTSTPVAFLGLGTMGGPMAANIARAGFPTTVWNRSPGKSGTPEEAGANVASSAAEAARDARVVVTMLTGDQVLDDLLFGDGGVADAMSDGDVLVEMSTTSPDFVREAAQRLAGRGVRVVDAPVFGSSEPAASGDLWAVVGAAEEDLAAVRPVLDSMAGTVWHLGDVGAGSQMKVCGNLVVTGMLSLLAESLTLGRSGGLDQRQMIEVLGSIDFQSPLFGAKGGQMVDENWQPGFALKHALKDIGLAQDSGAKLGVPLRTVAGVREDFAAAVDAGHGEDDVAAVVLGLQS
jgi:3-hydroxyisobutyrate dehydrogenase-like beta-hydroxyacid dehydrogenase